MHLVFLGKGELHRSYRYALLRDLAQQQVAGPQEGGHKLGLRFLVQLLRGAYFQQAPEAHHADAVCQVEGFFLVVGHQDGGDAQLALDGFQRAAQLHPDFGVQSAQRLVQQQHFRLVSQGARQGNALLLPARELLGHAVAQPCQPYQVEQLVAALAALGGGRFADAQPELHVLRHRHVLEQGIVLEDKPHPALLGRQVSHIPPVQQHPPVIHPRQAGDQAQDGGLSAAARAEQDEELAIAHF